MYPIYLEESETTLEFYENLETLRQKAQENQRDLDSRYYQRSYTRISQPKDTSDDTFGGFFLRTALSLLIFCGFLWLQKENRSVLGMAPEAVQEVISQNVVLPEEGDSATIETVTDKQR